MKDLRLRVTIIALLVFGGGAAGAMAVALGWMTVEQFGQWWDKYTFFEFVALIALTAGMVQTGASVVVVLGAFLLFRLFSVSDKKQERLFEFGGKLGDSLLLLYGVPGAVCGWIALSWWLLTGDYLEADRNHPGILERTVGILGFVGGRVLGVVGFLCLATALIFVASGLWKAAVEHFTMRRRN